jgi:hypothetical protein
VNEVERGRRLVEEEGVLVVIPSTPTWAKTAFLYMSWSWSPVASPLEGSPPRGGGVMERSIKLFSCSWDAKWEGGRGSLWIMSPSLLGQGSKLGHGVEKGPALPASGLGSGTGVGVLGVAALPGVTLNPGELANAGRAPDGA